ncbi:hypothetical protein J2Z48_002664 [Croceifilum oryzae]|uniref:Uncharacterized protein n=1 Tax=Croceifilum oryzae TaxID=1553429 RepID=A0AAJ1TL30_9BACL|nr:hypothetical protein [Croceifilum oryzae]MDQ0418472.1 hypothetical protein [Croceifilum oryzae]
MEEIKNDEFLECKNYKELFEAIHYKKHTKVVFKDLTVLFSDEKVFITTSANPTPIAFFDIDEIYNHRIPIKRIIEALC